MDTSSLPAVEQHVAKNLRKWREDRNWTRAEMAQLLTDMGLTGMHQTTIARLESLGDDHRPMRVAEALAIAQLFEVDLGDLVESEYGGTIRFEVGMLASSKYSFTEAARQLMSNRFQLARQLDEQVPVGDAGWGDSAAAVAAGVSASVLASAETELAESAPQEVLLDLMIERNLMAARDQPEGSRLANLIADTEAAITALNAEVQHGERQEAP